MEKDSLAISKDMFVSMKQENINNYYDVLAKELGKGAFGVVYKGRLKNTNGPWRAIKKIPKSFIKDSSMLVNEINISTKMDNPNIVKLYEIFDFNSCIYLVYDLCEGGELFDRLDKQGCLSEKDARILFRQMVEAINYLHLSKIAHRDLKPENFLFLTEDSNNIKLIDFGLALKWKENLNKELKDMKDKKIVGTSYYLAPQILSHNYDERCDIWSLGVILYILISACPPFDGDNDKQIMQSVKTMKYTFDIPQFNSVSKDAKDLISKMLQPAEKRITVKEIFNHPWMSGDVSSTTLKISFRKMHEFSKFSKLKKLTATFVASQMSEKQVEKLGQLFRKIDVNHDGYIEIEELKLALGDESSWIEMKELKALMDSIDIDKNGRINYTEFLACSLSKDELFSTTNMLKMFKLLDKDGSGEIDKSEMAKIFSENNIEELNGKSIDQLFKTCDKDNSGSISFQEFKMALLE